MFLWKIRVIISLQWWLKFVLTGFAEMTPSQAFISLYLGLGNSLFAYLLFSILPHFIVFATQDLGTPFQYLHFQVLESTVSGTTPLPLSVQEVQVSMALFTLFQERHGSGLAYLNPKLNSKTSPGFLRSLCRPEAYGHQIFVIRRVLPWERSSDTEMARRGGSTAGPKTLTSVIWANKFFSVPRNWNDPGWYKSHTLLTWHFYLKACLMCCFAQDFHNVSSKSKLVHSFFPNSPLYNLVPLSLDVPVSLSLDPQSWHSAVLKIPYHLLLQKKKILLHI